jgi:hypothetical protein
MTVLIGLLKNNMNYSTFNFFPDLIILAAHTSIEIETFENLHYESCL